MISIPPHPLATIQQAEPHAQRLVGVRLKPVADVMGIDTKRNKGWKGQAAEYLFGFTASVRAIDALDFELKCIPGRFDAQGRLRVKWEAAITMLNIRDVREVPFRASFLRKKLGSVLWIIVVDEPAGPVVAGVRSTRFKDWPKKLKTQVQQDYEDIRCLVERGAQVTDLSGAMGVCVMPKTKGQGRGAPQTRCFYARADFLNLLLFDAPECPPRLDKRQHHSGTRISKLHETLDMRRQKNVVARIAELQAEVKAGLSSS